MKVFDLAKAAFDRALANEHKMGALETSVKTVVEQLREWKQDTRDRLSDFEARNERRIQDLEARIRTLESENAKLQGLVASALGDALKANFQDRNPQAAQAALRAIAAPSEPESGSSDAS